MGIPYILVLFIIFVIILQFFMYKGGKGYRKSFDDFLEAERNANFSRKKNIPIEYYVKLEPDKMPFIDYPNEEQYKKVTAKQNNIKKLMEKPMVHFDETMTNREIKMQFGTAHLEDIITYEETFNQFMRTLLEWAEELEKLGNMPDCEQVLKIAIDTKCELSRVYLMLANIYAKQEKKTALLELKENLEKPDAFAYNKAIKRKIIDHIEGLYNA